MAAEWKFSRGRSSNWPHGSERLCSDEAGLDGLGMYLHYIDHKYMAYKLVSAVLKKKLNTQSSGLNALGGEERNEEINRKALHIA